MSDFEGKIPGFHERQPSDLGDHPSYHTYFTTNFATACHRPRLHIIGIIHDRKLVPALSAELQEKELGGLEDFSRTTFVYGTSVDDPVSYDNVTTEYGRSRKQSLIGLAEPRPLTARELLNREKANSLLEVYLNTKPFIQQEKRPLNAEGAKLLILNELVRSMMNMPRPQPPAEVSPRWLAAVLSRKERQRRQDPRLIEKEKLVGQFVSRYRNAITLELGTNPDTVTLPDNLPPKKMREWQLRYARGATEIVSIDDEEPEKPPET